MTTPNADQRNSPAATPYISGIGKDKTATYNGFVPYRMETGFADETQLSAGKRLTDHPGPVNTNATTTTCRRTERPHNGHAALDCI